MSKSRELRVIRLSISPKERERFFAVAEEMDASPFVLMRHLARYAIKEEQNLSRLLTSPKMVQIITEEEITENGGKKKAEVRASMSSELYEKFAHLVKLLGSNPTAIMKRLVLLYANGEIEKNAILIA